MQGPTGLTGMAGRQGVGFVGPTGPTGLQGFEYPGFTNTTGPTGPVGFAGPAAARPGGSTYTLSVYQTGFTGLASPSLDSTPNTIWSATIPQNVKGKHGLLSLYFDMTTNWVVPPTTQFDYGVYIDGSSIAMGGSPTQRYIQTIADTSMMSFRGRSLGVSSPTPTAPLRIPVTINPTATALQIRAANAQSVIDSLIVSPTPTIVSTVGSNTFTTPAGSIGVLSYVWGCGGASFQSNAGGPGGFAFGYFPCSAGTVLTTIVGGLGTNTFNSGFGGPGLTGVQGAGGGFSGVFQGTGPSSNSSVSLVIAGGGGGCSVFSTGPSFMWVGGGGGGQLGASAFNYARFQSAGLANAFIQGGGGGQTAPGSSGGRWNGAGYSQGNGAGGGGYYGGGRGEVLNQGLAGGGGSGFLAANIQRGYMPLANIATTTMTNTSNVTAPLSDLMETFGMSPTVYGHGSGGTGLIVLVPVLGSNVAPIIGVDARFITG